MAVPSPQVPGAPSLAAGGRTRAEPPTQRSIEVVRGAVPKQQPRERERGSSYSARRDNVDNAMPTVRTMTCTHITWVVMVHMKDRQSHAHRLHGLRVVRTDTCPGRVECDRRRTKCELCAKCAGQGDRRMLASSEIRASGPCQRNVARYKGGAWGKKSRAFSSPALDVRLPTALQVLQKTNDPELGMRMWQQSSTSHSMCERDF